MLYKNKVMELLITDRLHKGCMIKGKSPRLISMRKLSAKEISFARKKAIRRYYLPSLNEYESADYFKEFDKFWDQVIKPFRTDHPFWRNVVSSKMQEWERSVAYLALILFTLAQKAPKEPLYIVFVCSSLEEEDVCEEWGKKMGWKVYRRPYLSLPRWIRRSIQETKNLKDFLLMSCICLYKKWFSPGNRPKLSLTDKKILIASLFYSSSFKGDHYVDPFFGSLHNIVKQKGKSVTYLAGPLGNYKESAKKVRDSSDASIIIPYSIIRWAELISLVLKVFMRRVRLPKTIFYGCDFSRLIMWNARRFEYFFNLDSEIYFRAMTNLGKIEHFERLIQLYEGNVFERGCIQAFKKDNSSGLIVGYSHAVVYPLNLKIRLTGNEKKQKPEPDILISTGPETKRLMTRIGKRESSSVLSGCSLRNIPVLDDIKTLRKVRSDILVALDGVWSCVTVLDWLMEQAEIFKDYKIRLRGHPNVPVEKLLAQCINALPDNFHLSNNDLKADIENSFCVIYRQTSVGMQALMNGVPAIHLNIDAPLSCDPIMDLEISKWTVSSPEEFSAVLQEIYSLEENQRGEAVSIARKYTEEYFTVPDEENIMRFFVDDKTL
ncbi:hypothetical protein ES707_04020 [subsurface metagenome]